MCVKFDSWRIFFSIPKNHWTICSTRYKQVSISRIVKAPYALSTVNDSLLMLSKRWCFFKCLDIPKFDRMIMGASSKSFKVRMYSCWFNWVVMSFFIQDNRWKLIFHQVLFQWYFWSSLHRYYLNVILLR